MENIDARNDRLELKAIELDAEAAKLRLETERKIREASRLRDRKAQPFDPTKCFHQLHIGRECSECLYKSTRCSCNSCDPSKD